MASKPRPWAVAFWLLAWQGASMALAAAYPHGALLLASPLRAALRLLELLPSAAFWRAAGTSSARILGGFLVSCAPTLAKSTKGGFLCLSMFLKPIFAFYPPTLIFPHTISSPIYPITALLQGISSLYLHLSIFSRISSMPLFCWQE